MIRDRDGGLFDCLFDFITYFFWWAYSRDLSSPLDRLPMVIFFFQNQNWKKKDDVIILWKDDVVLSRTTWRWRWRCPSTTSKDQGQRDAMMMMMMMSFDEGQRWATRWYIFLNFHLFRGFFCLGTFKKHFFLKEKSLNFFSFDRIIIA